jgi:hypothetical protein
MTDPLNASTSTDGTRFYTFQDPSLGELRLPGVSTITRQMHAPELGKWQIGRVAQRLVTDDDLRLRCLDAIEATDNEDDARRAVQYIVHDEIIYKPSKESELGTNVHKVIELHEEGKIPDDVEEDEELSPYLDAWQKLVEKHKLEVIGSELQLVHTFHGYAGSTDHFVVSPDFGPVILDVKTGKRVYPNVAMQLAAYAHANHRWDGEKLIRWGSDVRKDLGLVAKIARTPTGKVTANLYTVNLRVGWDAFRACLELHKFSQRTGIVMSTAGGAK